MNFKYFMSAILSAMALTALVACEKDSCDPNCQENTEPNGGQIAVDGGTDSQTAPSKSPCDTFGVSGVLVAYAKYETPDDKFLMLSGEIAFPPKAGAIDFQFGDLCWVGDAGDDELICILPNANRQSAESWPYTMVTLEPGLAEAAQSKMADSLCDGNGCVKGLYVICAGDEEVCRVEDGEKSDNVEWSDSDIKRMVCTVPLP